MIPAELSQLALPESAGRHEKGALSHPPKRTARPPAKWPHSVSRRFHGPDLTSTLTHARSRHRSRSRGEPAPGYCRPPSGPPGLLRELAERAGPARGTIGVAPLHAVLSFLRREGDAYANVTTPRRRVRRRVDRAIDVAAAAGADSAAPPGFARAQRWRSAGGWSARANGSRAIARLRRERRTSTCAPRSSAASGSRSNIRCAGSCGGPHPSAGVVRLAESDRGGRRRGTGKSTCVLKVALLDSAGEKAA